MDPAEIIRQVAIWALPILLAITVHEAAHGWVANRLGDSTARVAGRLTLNPLRHIDPIGTLLIPLLTLSLAGFFFGWAKPVPVNWANLRRPRRDMGLVAAAGPAANFMMALCWLILLKISLSSQQILGFSPSYFLYASLAGIFANTVLMILNFLPIPPLDGGRVLAGLLPKRFALKLDKIEPYGLLILVGLLLSGVFAKVFWPLVEIAHSFYSLLIGMQPQSLQWLLQQYLFH